MLDDSFRPIPHDDLNVCIAVAGQILPRRFGDVWPAFYASHKVREVSEQRRLKAVARTDLEDVPGALKL